MRLERLNYDKIKIFLTLDDLMDRGLSREDLWRDSLKVHQLFQDMMNEASEELGFEPNGPIAIEVFSLQAQGMVIIVTKSQIDTLDEEFIDDVIEMQVMLDERNAVLYGFDQFEDVIRLGHVLSTIQVTGGTLFLYQGRYYLWIKDIPELVNLDSLIAILAEYGSSTPITPEFLGEYGQNIMDDNAVETITTHFNLFKN
ncbi:genetic competence negative regulator [Bacillus carboniphilus]|uniref:Adapter protein MecA n=1 Tax=Bacillus carboniphilus TaxID=86663 RepID=A0ABY9K1N7_9BACI|nr:genetic competence negative regulator [Bacillus carboniphilus]WLR43760.1 genetic competence negative regulator [Bacillus carboniphilus]